MRLSVYELNSGCCFFLPSASWFVFFLFFSHFPFFPSLCSLQSSELDDILNDLQNVQPQLFCELRPVSLPSPMDKQNIINDILQMSETNPAAATQQQQHRGMAGVGPTSKSHVSVETNSLTNSPSGGLLVLKLAHVCLQTSEVSDRARRAGVCL